MRGGTGPDPGRNAHQQQVQRLPHSRPCIALAPWITVRLSKQPRVHSLCRRGSLQRAECAEGKTIMTNAENGTFLTVAEVAEIMRVSKMTVYRLVHAGELPAVRVGRSFRVHESAVKTYLDSSFYDAG